MGLILYIFWYNNFRIHSKTGGFSLLLRHMQIFPSLNCIMLIFLPRRRFVTETFCFGDVLLQETFCYGDVLCTETFCMETFCRRDVLCGDVLYVRPFLKVLTKLLIVQFTHISFKRRKIVTVKKIFENLFVQFNLLC
jgi:hypothetical protein